MSEITHADVVVVGATPSGIFSAIRAAREGCSVLLTQHDGHVGGMCTNGLGQWDALSQHKRCPLFREVLDLLAAQYEGTEDEATVAYNWRNYPVGSFAPGSMERLFETMLAKESNIVLWRNTIPTATAVEQRVIRSITFNDKAGTEERHVTAKTIVDATYEGDVLPLAGVAYHVGREGREEFDEPHAGKIFTGKGQPVPQAVPDLMLREYNHEMSWYHPDSPGTGDGAIQAYNMRGCLSYDPDNRILIETAPEVYDRREYEHYIRRYMTIQNRCEKKASYNTPILPGENHAYPEASWAEREAITRRHMNFGLGLLHFLQFDDSIPKATREANRQWGLAADEWTDNNHVPYEMYVRETRRMRGRYVLRQQDFMQAPGCTRTPAFEDSVAFTDWYMDSHSCTEDGTNGNNCTDEYIFDGKLILSSDCRPGNIPYRALLATEVDNLIVPVCCSTTHVAWGAVRLEPCWMHLGEVAGYAAALAKRDSCDVAALSVSSLQTTLLEAGASLVFLNDEPNFLEDANRRDIEMRVIHGEYDAWSLHALQKVGV